MVVDASPTFVAAGNELLLVMSEKRNNGIHAEKQIWTWKWEDELHRTLSHVCGLPQETAESSCTQAIAVVALQDKLP